MTANNSIPKGKSNVLSYINSLPRKDEATIYELNRILMHYKKSHMILHDMLFDPHNRPAGYNSDVIHAALNECHEIIRILNSRISHLKWFHSNLHKEEMDRNNLFS